MRETMAVKAAGATNHLVGTRIQGSVASLQQFRSVSLHAGPRTEHPHVCRRKDIRDFARGHSVAAPDQVSNREGKADIGRSLRAGRAGGSRGGDCFCLL
jgi:hypothetical protein